MSAYSETFVALVSGNRMTAGVVAHLLAQLREETAHELAQEQRAYANKAYAATEADPYAQQRIKRRKKGAAYAVAALIDPAAPNPPAPSGVQIYWSNR
ncbi:hypothetical protein QFW82_23515 [Streptomyces malaysiensis subsp. malaysiensis]|uniref:hypothetical protein n=1 Tax=Streptomyces malaysiensis TaxID=92644 RepID=UPI0024BF4EFA|nr:hypothetical protein [Streptomyces sp. NA07423]WHX19800.1 hypothetical protein QFW82_23515 [Streptomyces sp. NA07423]